MEVLLCTSLNAHYPCVQCKQAFASWLYGKDNDYIGLYRRRSTPLDSRDRSGCRQRCSQLCQLDRRKKIKREVALFAKAGRPPPPHIHTLKHTGTKWYLAGNFQTHMEKTLTCFSFVRKCSLTVKARLCVSESYVCCMCVCICPGEEFALAAEVSRLHCKARRCTTA